MSRSMRYIYLVSRTLLALIFLFSGVGKIIGWHATAGYMASKGMFAVPLFLTAAVVLEIGGSLLLISGLSPKLGASMLILMLIPTTLIFHNFWAATGQAHQMQMTQFLKNLSILGGLGVVVSLAPGRISGRVGDATCSHRPGAAQRES